jgi:HEAT repeat protein
MSAVEANDLDLALERYETYRESEGADPGLLSHVAGLLLEQAAVDDDEAAQSAAFTQLGMAGTAARESLERLSAVGREAAVRAKALEFLARSGDGGAADALRGMLDAEEWNVLASAVTVLDGDDDEALLLAYLEHPCADVRNVAARKLADAAPAGAVRAALAEAARVDPEARVRASSVTSLGEFGAEAFEMLRERLSDADEQVRLAAVRAIVRADRALAVSVLGPLLEMAPNPAGIEAARVLAGGGRQAGDPVQEGHEEGETLARAYLRRALESAAPNLRSQAAVALSSLEGVADLGGVLSAALETEEDPQVRLGIATILVGDEATADKGFAALAEIMAGDGVPAVQAAALLAGDEERGGDAAVSRLRALMTGEDANVRRVAARALARDAREPDAARVALRDEDQSVRLSAAGGILAVQNVL